MLFMAAQPLGSQMRLGDLFVAFDLGFHDFLTEKMFRFWAAAGQKKMICSIIAMSSWNSEYFSQSFQK